MAWGFKDWVRGRPFRRDPDELNLPDNASEGNLRAIALVLLDNSNHGLKAHNAFELLNKQSAHARPVLESLLREDARFRSMSYELTAWRQPAYAVVLSILGQWRSELAFTEALSLARSPDAELRAVGARVLAESGQARFSAVLAELSNDADDGVRLALSHGIDRVLEYGKQQGRHLELELTRAIYPFMRDCALRTTNGPGGIFASALFAADRDNATRDFDPNFALAPSCVWLEKLIATLRAERVPIPKAKVFELLDYAVAVLDRGDVRTNEFRRMRWLIPSLLELQAEFDHSTAFKQIENLKKHHQEDARAAALDAEAKLRGDPVKVALNAYQGINDIRSLRPEHATVCLVYLLDAEVCNGGWEQWVANSWGEYAKETLLALRTIGAEAAAEQLEQVISTLGPGGSSPDQSTRMAALDRMLNAGKSLPDDGIMWGLSTDLKLLIRDHASRHPDAFPPSR